MHFNSKLEAMSFAIIKLNQIKINVKEVTVVRAIEDIIEKIKVAFENHEQNMEVIYGYLTELLPQISENDVGEIKHLMNDIKESDYYQTLQKKFENPLARREESELFAYLLTDPTPSMMQAVNLVSTEILKTIERLKTEDSDLLESFLEQLKESAHFIACGAFKETPSVSDIEQILQTNNPQQLAEIMHIHFKFGRCVVRETPIYAPERPPVGKLADITKNYPGFFETIKHNDAQGEKARSYIIDSLIYDSDLFTYIPGKGREGALKKRPSNRLSLMRDSQCEYDTGLPERKNSWVPDCRGQDPDFYSPYVLEAINNDTPYVSGPSGMTSVLLGQMEFMANLPDVTLKQNYLTAVVSYVVGPGFHCLHEVIGPAQYVLNLVPGYNVFTPGKPKSLDEMKLPASPQYNVFFKQQCSIDPQFSEKRQAAWDRYLDFFQNVYMPKHFPAEKATLSM